MQKDISQKETIGNELTKISVDVTEQDKREFSKQYGVSLTSISNYLNGRMGGIDTGLDMLLFFRNKIAERYVLINESAKITPTSN